MKVLMRKTISGSEYWDTEAKRTIFVKKGKEPDFEVTAESTTDKNTSEAIDLNSMTIAQLKEYAADSGIEIPADVTKKDDIVKYLSQIPDSEISNENGEQLDQSDDKEE